MKIFNNTILGVVDDIAKELDNLFSEYLKNKLLPYKIILILIGIFILILFITKPKSVMYLEQEVYSLEQQLKESHKANEYLQNEIDELKKENTIINTKIDMFINFKNKE